MPFFQYIWQYLLILIGEITTKGLKNQDSKIVNQKDHQHDVRHPSKSFNYQMMFYADGPVASYVEAGLKTQKTHLEKILAHFENIEKDYFIILSTMPYFIASSAVM